MGFDLADTTGLPVRRDSAQGVGRSVVRANYTGEAVAELPMPSPNRVEAAITAVTGAARADFPVADQAAALRGAAHHLDSSGIRSWPLPPHGSCRADPDA